MCIVTKGSISTSKLLLHLVFRKEEKKRKVRLQLFCFFCFCFLPPSILLPIGGVVCSKFALTRSSLPLPGFCCLYRATLSAKRLRKLERNSSHLRRSPEKQFHNSRIIINAAKDFPFKYRPWIIRPFLTLFNKCRAVGGLMETSTDVTCTSFTRLLFQHAHGSDTYTTENATVIVGVYFLQLEIPSEFLPVWGFRQVLHLPPPHFPSKI